jgi:hypothetical protein
MGIVDRYIGIVLAITLPIVISGTFVEPVWRDVPKRVITQPSHSVFLRPHLSAQKATTKIPGTPAAVAVAVITEVLPAERTTVPSACLAPNCMMNAGIARQPLTTDAS